MTSARADERAPRPALLCYDGSDNARGAIEEAGAVLGGGPAVVLTVWESIGPPALRHPIPAVAEFGRDFRDSSKEVVAALDAQTAAWARATAAEGAELARGSSFDARPVAHRALGRPAEPIDGTVWQAVIDIADQEDAAVIVLGSRGSSGLKAALLGSVSYGVVHNADRPVLTVPPADG